VHDAVAEGDAAFGAGLRVPFYDRVQWTDEFSVCQSPLRGLHLCPVHIEAGRPKGPVEGERQEYGGGRMRARENLGGAPSVLASSTARRLTTLPPSGISVDQKLRVPWVGGVGSRVPVVCRHL
jgi:hypothetical protein